MACSVGGMIHIDFKNPEEPVVEKVPSDFEAYQYSLCIVDTKASHADLTDDYAQIPADMKKVAKFFKKNFLREVPEEEFYNQISAMPCSNVNVPSFGAVTFFTSSKMNPR